MHCSCFFWAKRCLPDTPIYLAGKILSGDILPAPYTASQSKIPQSEPHKAPAPEKPVLSFLPAGKPRSIAEHLVAALAGALLLFLFFMASELAVRFMADIPLMSVTFVPVICLLPVLAGALAAIVFEKLRKAQPGIKRGAAVGALSGFFGSLLSSFVLFVLSLLNMKPFGDAISSTLMVFAVLVVTIGVDTILAALGGALVVKFTSEK